MSDEILNVVKSERITVRGVGARGPAGPAGGSGGGGGDVSFGGNTATSDKEIGLISNFALKFKTNNVVRMFISAMGSIGLGVNTPDTQVVLDIYKQSNGSARQGNIQSILELVDTSDGSQPQMSLYATNHADHDTGVFTLLRNYLMSEMSGDGVVTETYGARALTRIFDRNQPDGDTSTGVIQNAYGLEAYANNTSTGGRIRRATGIVISAARATGSDAGQPHIARGIWIQNAVEASGGSTNEAYAIDSESTAPSRFYGDVLLQNGKVLKLFGSGSGGIFLKAPNGNYTPVNYIFPQAPDAGKFLTVDADGIMSWGTPAGGGGGGGSGDVNFGGNTAGGNKSIGLHDAFKLAFITNDIERFSLAATGEMIVGGANPSDLGGNPLVFGVYKFDITDNARCYQVFDNYFSFYGNSNSSKDGTRFNFAVRPGEAEFTYGGELNSLAINAYLNSAGVVNTLTGLKNALACLSGSGIIQTAVGNLVAITAPSGVINKAVGIQVQTVQAKGAHPNAKLAIGIDIANDGAGVTAADSTGGANIAIGLRIGNNVSGGTDSIAIQSTSDARSEFKGPVEGLSGFKVATASAKPAASAALRGTFWNVQGGSGVADVLQVCVKDASNAYVWKTVTLV